MAFLPTQYACSGLRGYQCASQRDCAADEVCARGWCEQAKCIEGTQRACYSHTKETLGRGICEQGLQTCQNNAWSSCAGEVLPKTEICNGQDDNCDGDIDEGLVCDCLVGRTRTCYTHESQWQGRGACSEGVQTCTKEARWGACIGDKGPTQETCNNQDDDCDGKVDNAAGNIALSRICYNGSEATAGVGVCRKGIQLCTKGSWGRCLGDINPSKERCDGLDNDCDGQLDEDCPPCASKHFRGFVGSPYSHKVEHLAWSSDGALFAAANSSTIQIWSHTKRQYERSILTSDELQALSFVPGQAMLMALLSDHSIALYDAQSGRRKELLKGHTSAISAFAFTSDGKMLFTASARGNKIIKWDLSASPITPQLWSTRESVDHLWVDANNQHLLAASGQDATLVKWSLATAQRTAFTGACPQGHLGAAITASEGVVAICQGATGHVLLRWPPGALSPQSPMQLAFAGLQEVIFAADGERALLLSRSGPTPSLIETRQAKVLYTFPLSTLVTGVPGVKVAALSANGSDLLVSDGSERLWTWRVGANTPNPAVSQPVQRHTQSVQAWATNHRGTQLATAGASNKIYLWDVFPLSRSFGTLHTTLESITGVGDTIAFSPDGKRLVHSDLFNQIIVWNLQTQEIELTLSRHTQPITQLLFSLDGSQLLSVSRVGSTAIRWDFPTGRFVRYLAHQGLSVLALHSDGKHLALGSEGQGIVRVYPFSTKTPLASKLAEFKVSANMPINGLAFFSSADNLLATTDVAQTLNWQAQTRSNPIPTNVSTPRISVHPQGHIFAVENEGGMTFFSFDASTQSSKELGQLLYDRSQGRGIQNFLYGRVANLMFTSHQNGWIKAWHCVVGAQP